jgi:hypothetical protein
MCFASPDASACGIHTSISAETSRLQAGSDYARRAPASSPAQRLRALRSISGMCGAVEAARCWWLPQCRRTAQ